MAFLEKEFPQSLEKCRIESVTERGATVVYQVRSERFATGWDSFRPNHDDSWQTMHLYVAILGEIGLVGLAVTTNLISQLSYVNLLASTDIRGECKLMKVGKALVVGRSVDLFKME